MIMNKTDYKKILEEVIKIIENEPPEEYEPRELEFPSNQGIILCGGNIFPDPNPTARIKYSD